MRHLCSGNILASQARAPGSIPGWRMEQEKNLTLGVDPPIRDILFFFF
jgi:hypothetical protein